MTARSTLPRTISSAMEPYSTHTMVNMGPPSLAQMVSDSMRDHQEERLQALEQAEAERLEREKGQQ